MSKKQKYFEKIQEYKDRFKDFTLEKLQEKERTGYLLKEAAIAIRELIEEKQKTQKHSTK